VPEHPDYPEEQEPGPEGQASESAYTKLWLCSLFLGTCIYQAVRQFISWVIKISCYFAILAFCMLFKSMYFDMRLVDFRTVLPLWRQLWPERQSPIEPVSTMKYLGGFDTKIAKQYQARFFGMYHSDQLIGVISGHPTSPLHYRTRGIYVLPEYQRHGIGRRLILIAFDAAVASGQQLIWALPRVTSATLFEKCGFTKLTIPVKDRFEFGPHIYVMRSCI